MEVALQEPVTARGPSQGAVDAAGEFKLTLTLPLALLLILQLKFAGKLHLDVIARPHDQVAIRVGPLRADGGRAKNTVPLGSRQDQPV